MYDEIKGQLFLVYWPSSDQSNQITSHQGASSLFISISHKICGAPVLDASNPLKYLFVEVAFDISHV